MASWLLMASTQELLGQALQQLQQQLAVAGAAGGSAWQLLVQLGAPPAVLDALGPLSVVLLVVALPVLLALGALLGWRYA